MLDIDLARALLIALATSIAVWAVMRILRWRSARAVAGILPAVAGGVSLLAPSLAFVGALGVQVSQDPGLLPLGETPLAFDEPLRLDRPEAAVEVAAACSECEQLRPADLFFNAPSVMQFEEPKVIELVLVPDSADPQRDAPLSEDLEGEVRAVRAAHALQTRATLRGPDFTVDPAGPVAITVLPDRPARWSWTVVPGAFGEGKLLTLSVEAVVMRNGVALPPVPIETFRTEIHVKVSVWDWFSAWVAEVATVWKVLFGGTIGSGALLAAAWLWRNRWWKPPPPDDYDPGFKGGSGGT